MASFAGPPSGLEISEEMPVKDIADKNYEYWKECGGGNIKFIMYILKYLKPILLTDGLPNKSYKNFLRHFTFTYLRYDKRFITSLFQTALEENAITGVIRIVRNDRDKFYLENVIKVKEPVFTDYKLLDKLIELAEIVPQILMDSKINTYSDAISNAINDAVLSNSIIIFLNMARPPIAVHIQCPLNVNAAASSVNAAASSVNAAASYIAHNTAIIKRKRSNNNQPTKNRKIAWKAGTRKKRRKLKTLHLLTFQTPFL
jgi:hypothetical protein